MCLIVVLVTWYSTRLHKTLTVKHWITLFVPTCALRPVQKSVTSWASDGSDGHCMTHCTKTKSVSVYPCPCLTVSHRVSPNHSRKIFRLEKIAFLKRLVELLEIRHDKTWKDRQVHGLVHGQVMSPSSSNVTWFSWCPNWSNWLYSNFIVVSNCI